MAGWGFWYEFLSFSTIRTYFLLTLYIYGIHLKNCRGSNSSYACDRAHLILDEIDKAVQDYYPGQGLHKLSECDVYKLIQLRFPLDHR